MAASQRWSHRAERRDLRRFHRRFCAGSGYYGEPRAAPGDLAAERALFRAHCADPSVPPIAAEIDRWLGELSADEARRLLTRFDDKAPTMPCRAYEAIAWMTLRVLSAPDAASVLVWMLLDGCESQLNNAAHDVEQALTALLAQHPALREGAVERVRAHGHVPRLWGVAIAATCCSARCRAQDSKREADPDRARAHRRDRLLELLGPTRGPG